MALVDGSIKAPTLASVIASRLEDEVVAQGWPVGRVIGSESDLLDRFGVSRAVLREAVRIVEHTGAARMRRGPGGGLVVAQPNRSAVVTAMGVWFSYVGVTVDEMLEARMVVLEGACRLAAAQSRRRATADALIATIDAAADSEEISTELLAAVELAIAGLARNAVLTLFVESVAELGLTRLRSGTAHMVPPVSPAESLAQLAGYRTVVVAIADGDADLAASRIERLVTAVRARMRDTRSGGWPSPSEPPSGKLAEGVANALRDDIERARWPVGEVVGSESELIERHGVSRAILREAVRILEHHGAVRTKRGPRGGIIVGAPDNAPIVRAARLILVYEGVTSANLYEARSILEVAAARLAAERCTPELVGQLRAIVDTEARLGDAARSFVTLHHAIADGTGNRVFALYVDVMGELVPAHTRPERSTPEAITRLSVEVHRVHELIVRAITDGDADLASKRMLRHMVASVEILR